MSAALVMSSLIDTVYHGRSQAHDISGRHCIG